MQTDIKVGNVTIPVYHCKNGTFLVKWKAEGKWRSTRRSTLVEAERQARRVAESILTPTMGLEGLTLAEYEVLSRARRLEITHAQLDEWEKAAKRQNVPVETCMSDFLLALLRKRGGREGAYIGPLRTDLRSFADWAGVKSVNEIKQHHLLTWLADKQNKGIGPRRMKNLFASVRTFLRWAERMGHIPKAADIMRGDFIPSAPKSDVEVYTPDEMSVLLQAIAKDEEALLWTVFCAFSGARSNEVMPSARCEKPGLRWEDVRWDEGVIVVPANVAKTGMRRIMPILPALEAWVRPRAQRKGRIATGEIRRAAERVNAALAEHGATFRLRKNGARHSYGSYRTAELKSAGQVALEMGNSEGVVKRHYLYHVTAAEAETWWNLRPTEYNLEQAS